MSFWGELKRRNVFKVGAAYAIVAWLIVQVATAILPSFEAPRWIIQTLVFLLVVGLPVALLLAWVYEVTPEGIKRTESVSPGESITPVTGQRLNYIVAALVAIAVVFLVAERYLPDDRGSMRDTQAAATGETASNPTRAAEEPAAPAVLENSVAVLPCTNFSTDPENAFFAASLHEELLDQLFKLRSLNVIARTSVLQYAGAARPVPEIANELGVEAVMECSVAYGDGRIVISAQLIEGATGLHLWSDRYNREFKDVFGIQSDIAMNVANAVGAQFSAAEQASIEQLPTSSPAAYALYLQARSLIAASDAQRIDALLDRALELDPEFASALGFKAGLYAGQLVNTSGNDAQDQAQFEPLIKDYAARALELDPQNPMAHAALASLDAFSWRWTEARESSLRAVESRGTLQAGAVVILPFWFLSWSGGHDDAIRFAERAAALNPRDWQGHWVFGIVLNYAGRYDDAAASLRKSIEMLPANAVIHAWLAYTEIARGDDVAALREMELTQQLLEDRTAIYLVDLAYSYGRLGDRDNAQRLYDEIEALAADQDIGAGGWALASMAIGDYEEGLRWLNVGAEKAARHELDAGMFSLMNLKLNFTADPRLETPEFVEVRNRLRGD
jgi:TolB-like protein/tetratricopeptide (TPR) repeat protein